MDLVVDANILFSVLIKRGKTEEIMFDSVFHLFAPEFIFEEFMKYRSYIIKKTGRTENEFNRLIEILKKRIKIISNEEIEKFIHKAKKICPDKKDIDYFALALRLNCALWSNDKELKNQNIILVYSTHELLKIFG